MFSSGARMGGSVVRRRRGRAVALLVATAGVLGLWSAGLVGSASAAIDAYLHFPNDSAQLIKDSQVVPGSALADKAAAIQTAGSAGDPTACADITGYLALVRAQTGKKLTQGQASVLTTDVQNVALDLGCQAV